MNIVKIAKMNNEIEKKKGKINMQLRSSNYYLNSEKETQKILNIKLKLNLNNENFEKKSERNSQKNITNIFKKIDTPQTVYPTKLLNNKQTVQQEENINKDIKEIPIYNLHSSSSKNYKEKIKKVSPNIININDNKDEEQPTKSLFSTNNIKKIKKPIKKIKAAVVRQHSFIPINKIKKNKLQAEENKEAKRTRRHSLIPQDVANKENRLKFFNILNNNEKK